MTFFNKKITVVLINFLIVLLQPVFADVVPPALNSGPANSLITIQAAPIEVNAYLNNQGASTFKQLQNYGKCSILAISYHNSFDGKAAPFHIFSDSVGDSIVLKASALDGSGNPTTINTQGKFDKILSLDTEVEDFPGKTPTFKYAISAAAKAVDLGSINSFWKSGCVNPRTNTFDPESFSNYVYNNPSQGRIFVKASQICTANNVDINNTPLNTTNWRIAGPTESYPYPSRSSMRYGTGTLPNPTDWFEILAKGRVLSGDPLIFNNWVVAKSAFGVPGSFFKTTELFKVNIDSDAARINGDDGWAIWDFVLQPTIEKAPSNSITKQSASLPDIMASFVSRRYWLDADLTGRNAFKDTKGQQVISLSKMAQGFVILTNTSLYCLTGKTIIPGGTFLDDFLTTGVNLASPSGPGPKIDFNKTKQYSKIVAGNDVARGTIYLACKKIDKTFEVYKLFGPSYSNMDSVIVNVGILDLSIDDKGHLAIIDAMNNNVWWANVDDILAQKTFYAQAPAASPNQQMLVLVQFISDRIGLTKQSIDNTSAYVRYYTQKLNDLLVILNNPATSSADWDSAWSDYLINDTALINYMTALEGYIDQCEDDLSYLGALRRTKSTDVNLQRLIDAATTFQANIIDQRTFLLNTNRDLLTRYDNLYRAKKAAFVSVLANAATVDLAVLEKATEDFRDFVSKMNDRKSNIFVRLQGYLTTLYDRRSNSTMELTKLVDTDGKKITSGEAFTRLSNNLTVVNNTIAAIKTILILRPATANTLLDIGNVFMTAFKQFYSKTNNNSFIVKALNDFNSSTSSDKSVFITQINGLAKKFLSISSAAEKFLSSSADVINSLKDNYISRVQVGNEDSDIEAMSKSFIDLLTPIGVSFLDSLKDSNPTNLENNIPVNKKLFIDDLTGMSSSLNNQMVTATNSLGTLLENMGSAYKSSGANLQTEIASLTNSLAGWKDLMIYAGGRAGDLKAKTNAANTAIADAQNKLVGSTTLVLQSLSAEMAQLNSSAASFDISSAKSATDLMNRFKFINDIKDSIISKLTANVTALANELSNVNSSNAATNAANAALVAKLRDDNKQAIDALTVAQRSCDSTVNSLKENYKNMLVGVLDVSRVPANLQGSVNAAKVSGSSNDLITAIKSIIGAQNTTIDQLNADNLYWKNLAANNQNNADDLNNLLRIANETNKQLQLKYNVDTATLTGQITTLQAQLSTAQQQGVADAAMIQKLNDEITRLTAENLQKMKDLGNVNSSLAQENERLKSQILRLDSSAKDLEKQRDNLTTQLNQANITIEQKNSLISQLQGVNTTYSEALKKQQDYSAQLLTDLNASRDSLRAKELILVQVQSDLAAMSNSRDLLKAELEAIIAEKTRIDSLNAQLIGNLEKINERLQTKLDTLQGQVDVLSDVIDKNLDLTIFKNIDQVVAGLQGQLQNSSLSDLEKSTIQEKLTSALQKQKNKNDLLSLMGLGSEEANLLNALIEGSVLSDSELDPYKLDWVLLDYKEINSVLLDLKLRLDSLGIELDKTTPGASNAAGINASSLLVLPEPVTQIGKILLAYEVFSTMVLQKKNADGSTIMVSPTDAYSSVAQSDRDIVEAILSPAELAIILRVPNDPLKYKSQKYKSQVAPVFTQKLFGPAAISLLQALTAWNPGLNVTAQASKLTGINSDSKSKFDALVAQAIDPTARRSMPWYKNEMMGIFSGDEQSIKATVSKAKLNVLIKLKNADSTLQKNNFDQTVQGLQTKANQEKADLNLAIASGKKTIDEAKTELLRIEKEKNDKIAKQQSIISGVSSSYEASSDDISRSKVAVQQRLAKSFNEQMIINYYQARSGALSGKTSAVRNMIANNVPGVSVSTLQALVDESERLTKWFDYANYIVPVAQSLAADGKSLKKYEIYLNDQNQVVVSNKEELTVSEEILLSWENDLEATRYYFGVDNLLEGTAFSNLSKNRFKTLENMIGKNQKLLVVNQSDNLFALYLVTTNNGVETKARISLIPVDRQIDLVSGIVGTSNDIDKIRADVKVMQNSIMQTLSMFKDYDVVLVPENEIRVADGSTIMLKLSSLTAGYDEYVGVQAFNKQGLINASPVTLFPATLSSEAVHFVMKKQGDKYQLFDYSGNFKLISQDDLFWQVDKDAAYFNTSNFTTMSTKDYNSSATKDNLVQVNDLFEISGSQKNVAVKNSSGKYLKVFSAASGEMRVGFDSSLPSESDKKLELETDEQFFYLEGAFPPASSEGVIIRAFSTRQNLNMHGYLSMKEVVSPVGNKEVSLAYKPWISTEVHSKPGMRETVFGLIRYTKPEDLTNAFWKYLQSLSVLDGSVIIDSSSGLTAKDKALSGALQLLSDGIINAKQNHYLFEEYINMTSDLFSYKMEKGLLQGKDASLIKDFITTKILQNSTAENLSQNSAARKSLFGTKNKDNKVVGGLANMSENLTSNNFSQNDIIALKFGDRYLGIKKTGTEFSVSLMDSSRINDSVNFVLQGDSTQGFMILDLSLKYKLIMNQQNQMAAVEVSTTGAIDRFKLNGDTLDKISISRVDGKQTLALKTTVGVDGLTKTETLSFGEEPFVFSCNQAKPNSFEASLLALGGKPSVTVDGVTTKFKDLLVLALKNDQSKMNQTLALAVNYLNTQVNENNLSIWFNEIQEVLFSQTGLLADDVLKKIDPELLQKIGSVVKTFSPDPAAFYVMSNERGEILGTITPPIETEKLITVGGSQKAMEISPLKFLDSKDEKGRNILFRFIPGPQSGVFGIAVYVIGLEDPSYLKVIDPVFANVNESRTSFSLVLGDSCLYDKNGGIGTNSADQLFEVRGSSSSIMIRSLATNQNFNFGNGYLVGQESSNKKASYLSAKSDKFQNGFDKSDSLKPLAERTVDPVLKLRQAESIEKDLYFAKSVDKYSVIFYTNLLAVVNEQKLDIPTKTARADAIIYFFKDFMTTSNPDGSLVYKELINLRGFPRIITDEAAGKYSLFDVLTFINDRLTFRALEGVGIKWSNEARGVFDKLMKLSRAKTESKEVGAISILSQQAEASFNSKLIKSGSDFPMVINKFILANDNDGLIKYLEELLQYLFNSQTLVINKTTFNVDGLAVLVPRNDLTLKNLNEFVDRLKRLAITVFATNPEHPIQQLTSQLIAKFSGGGNSAASKIASGYSDLSIDDRLTLAERMIKGGRYKDLSGKLKSNVDKVEAGKVLATISDTEISKSDNAAEYTKWRNELVLSLAPKAAVKQQNRPQAPAAINQGFQPMVF